MYQYVKDHLAGNQVGIFTIGSLCVLAALVGVVVGRNQKLALVILCLTVILLALRLFGVNTVLYGAALIWWLPVSLNRLVPEGVFGNIGYDVTLPELLVYAGILLLPFSKSNAADANGANRRLLDPTWGFLGLLVLGGLIASSAIQTLVGFSMFRRSTFYFLAVAVTCRYLLSDKKLIMRIWYLLLFSGALFIAYILIASRFPGTLFQSVGVYVNSSRVGGMYTVPRLGDFYFGPNNIGLIVGMQAVAALALTFMESSVSKRALAGAIFVLNTIVLVMTGSRGSMLSAAFVAILLVVYALWGKRKLTGIVVVVALAGAIAVLLPGLLTAEISGRLQTFSSVAALQNDSSAQTRFGLLQYGWQLFTEHPMGIGYATFVTLTDNSVLWEQNLFLNTALGGGVLGLIGLLGFFLILFRRGLSKVRSDGGEEKYLYLLCLCPSLVFLLNSLSSDPNVETCVYFAWLVLGIAFAGFSVRARPRFLEVSSTGSAKYLAGKP